MAISHALLQQKKAQLKLCFKNFKYLALVYRHSVQKLFVIFLFVYEFLIVINVISFDLSLYKFDKIRKKVRKSKCCKIYPFGLYKENQRLAFEFIFYFSFDKRELENVF